METNIFTKKIILLLTIGSTFSNVTLNPSLDTYANNIIPSKNISLEENESIYKKYTWENDINNNYNSEYSIEEKFTIISDFIKRISENSINLDKDIINMVNDNFWDLA